MFENLDHPGVYGTADVFGTVVDPEKRRENRLFRFRGNRYPKTTKSDNFIEFRMVDYDD